eukprot:492724-Rhodomonas_salina.2
MCINRPHSGRQGCCSVNHHAGQGNRKRMSPASSVKVWHAPWRSTHVALAAFFGAQTGLLHRHCAALQSTDQVSSEQDKDENCHKGKHA